MNLKHLFLAAALVALPASSLLAQSTTYGERHDINGRRGNEQSRIREGEANGQLTRHEARKLEERQHAIHREERNMRAANGGRLTAADRHTLARQQNRQSRSIYNQKHDVQTQPGVYPR